VVLPFSPHYRKVFARHGLKAWAISNHLVGQADCDPIDERGPVKAYRESRE